MANGADKPDTADRLGKSVNTGRPVHPPRRDRLKRTQGLEKFHDLLGADVFPFVPESRSANGHELDKPNLQRLGEGQPGKIDELVIINPL